MVCRCVRCLSWHQGEGVLTDNEACYTSRKFREACREFGIVHKRTRLIARKPTQGGTLYQDGIKRVGIYPLLGKDHVPAHMDISLQYYPYSFGFWQKLSSYKIYQKINNVLIHYTYK